MPNQRVSCAQWVPMQTEDARTKDTKYGSRSSQRKESTKGSNFSANPSIHGHFQLFLLEAARQMALLNYRTQHIRFSTLPRAAGNLRASTSTRPARHLIRTLLTLLILFCAATVSSVAAAQPAPDPLAKRVDEFVAAEMKRQKIPGMAVAIVRRGEVFKAQGYGLANVEHEVVVKPTTIFQSGSVGKQITAMAAMLMVEDGKLALSDPIKKYLKDAPASWDAITVRHLLTHTSGIPDVDENKVDYRRDYTEAQWTALIYATTPGFAAGQRWRYSNSDYQLLGFIIGKAGGKLYADVLAERVFKPLGMTTAGVISEADIVPNRAAGYRLSSGVLKNQE